MPYTIPSTLFANLQDDMASMRTVLHRQHIEAINALDSRLIEDTAWRRVLTYLLTAPRTPQQTINVSCYTISRVVRNDYRKPHGWFDHNMCTRLLVNDVIVAAGGSASFTDFVLPGVDSPGEATHLAEWDMGERLAGIVHGTSANSLKRKGYYDAVAGKPLSPQMARRRYQKMQVTVNDINSCATIKEVVNFAWYLNNDVAARQFAIADEDMQRCLDYVQTTYFDVAQTAATKRERRHAYMAGQSAMAQLRFISLWPRPLYSISDRSPRLFTKNFGLGTLPTDLRRLLKPNVIEIDLTSAQLAAFAKTANTPNLLAFLRRALSTPDAPNWWNYVAKAIGVETLSKEQKDIFKRVTYSLVFGMDAARLFTPRRSKSGRLQDDEITLAALNAIPKRQRAAFLNAPLVQEILEARAALFVQYRETGKFVDAWGKTHRLDLTTDPENPFDEKSALAYVAQSWEMRLLEGVRKLAIENLDREHGFTVVCWQHDGFSISCRPSDAERVCTKLGETIRRTADRLGVAVAAEVKYDGLTKSLAGRRF